MALSAAFVKRNTLYTVVKPFLLNRAECLCVEEKFKYKSVQKISTHRMGMNVSRQVDLTENEYLQRFVGKTHVPAYDDDFWNNFLQYHINLPTNRLVVRLYQAHMYLFLNASMLTHFPKQRRTTKPRFAAGNALPELYQPQSTHRQLWLVDKRLSAEGV